MYALIEAVKENDVEMARLLLHNGADTNRAMSDDGWTALMGAAEENHVEMARLLLQEGRANVNQAMTDYGSTALMVAAREGHVEVALLLLEEGKANVNQCSVNNGWTALMTAANYNNVSMVELLLRFGATFEFERIIILTINIDIISLLFCCPIYRSDLAKRYERTHPMAVTRAQNVSSYRQTEHQMLRTALERHVIPSVLVELICGYALSTSLNILDIL